MKAPKNETKERELVPVGNHVARLYNIMYLGTLETPYLNDDGTKKEQYKVRLTFELPNELREFGEDKKELPMVISKECTFSMYKGTHTAILRTIAHALIGESLKDEEAESFDIDELLGKACMVEVSHEEYDGNTYAKAVGFGSIPKGMTVPAQVNDNHVVSVHDSKIEDIEKLPEFLKKKITASKEYKARVGGTPVAEVKKEEVDSTSIPF